MSTIISYLAGTSIIIKYCIINSTQTLFYLASCTQHWTVHTGNYVILLPYSTLNTRIIQVIYNSLIIARTALLIHSIVHTLITIRKIIAFFAKYITTQVASIISPAASAPIRAFFTITNFRPYPVLCNNAHRQAHPIIRRFTL